MYCDVSVLNSSVCTLLYDKNGNWIIITITEFICGCFVNCLLFVYMCVFICSCKFIIGPTLLCLLIKTETDELSSSFVCAC